MNYKPPLKVFGPPINRISDVMAHTTRYAFNGVSRLALDAGVTPSAISRIISGKRNASSLMVTRIARALSQELGKEIDPSDLIAERGEFPTRFVCELCGCSGCLPENSHDEFESLKPTFENVRPGHWVTSRYPNGYIKQEVNAKA